MDDSCGYWVVGRKGIQRDGTREERCCVQETWVWQPFSENILVKGTAVLTIRIVSLTLLKWFVETLI
jgi:hypothetical protein